ncbi:hypothetical protein [Streptomyces flavofungini]|uniref:SMODS-associating 2TM beta-strand rich effector domain-containing protein n=1 Tax=Streptomyces flavofungini TaxID=68200 RepID=A0ABS0XIT2_9ACTN|nr:hypothetical protein [Streptomyces flavofungini]MBJ3813120.1 hypothetical protein [Streptomyces flavofungini]GHC89493.1 hypothetical protein GCM10010349_77360 [Streptomyces flavofungini]
MLDQVLIWLLLAIAGATVQRICDVVFGESIETIVYSLLIRRRTAAVNLRGQWRSAFEYISDDDGSVIVEERTLRVSQRGRRVTAKDPDSATPSRFRLQGAVSATGALSGEWEETSLAGRQYHGVFQFLLTRTGSEMRGRWVSYNRDDVIQSGSWTLCRI